MSKLVIYNTEHKIYDFFTYEDSTTVYMMGLHEDDLSHTLPFLHVVDWLLTQSWFTIEHLRQLFALSKKREPWNVWRIAEE